MIQRKCRMQECRNVEEAKRHLESDDASRVAFNGRAISRCRVWRRRSSRIRCGRSWRGLPASYCPASFSIRRELAFHVVVLLLAGGGLGGKLSARRIRSVGVIRCCAASCKHRDGGNLDHGSVHFVLPFFSGLRICPRYSQERNQQRDSTPACNFYFLRSL